MARTTVANTIERIRRQLASSHRSELNVLATTVNSSTTSIVLTYDLPASLVAGAIISIGVESMRVMARDTATKTVTVIRGFYDSDAAAHTAGDEVFINARYEPIDIFDAMRDEIGSWGPQLYKLMSDEFTVTAGDNTTELSAAWVGMHGIVDVRRKWDNVDATTWPRLQARLIRGVAADWSGADTSGLLLRFIEPVETGTVYVLVAMPFDVSTMATTDDLVTDIGLQASMLDMLGMGVKLRLAVDAENNRTSRAAQDTPRRAEEVPVASAVPMLQLNARMYAERRQQEAIKLYSRYPIRVI